MFLYGVKEAVEGNAVECTQVTNSGIWFRIMESSSLQNTFKIQPSPWPTESRH